ncbi:hypothetical protein WCP94_001170 [Bilophila wadsworthia]
MLQPAPSSSDCLRGIPASSPKWRTCPRYSGRGRSFQIGKTLAGGVSLASGPWCSGLSWH